MKIMHKTPIFVIALIVQRLCTERTKPLYDNFLMLLFSVYETPNLQFWQLRGITA